MRTIRNFSLLFMLVFISFTASADGGLASLSVAFERLLIIGFWSVSSLTLLIIFLSRYIRWKKTVFAVLVYVSLVSLSALYELLFYHFMDMSGSLIFDPDVDTMERDETIVQFWTLIVLGILLLLALAAFTIYHVRSAKRKKFPAE